jgi:predicted PurR-regulated permease PerM
MSTLAVFVSLLFWSWVWGIWGTILAVPLTSMIKAVSDHVEPLEWLSRLLSEDPGRAHQHEIRATSGAAG